MLVFTELSSMKTSFDGVNSGCCSRHSTRALATSSRACSAAWRDFFMKVRSSAASVLFISPVLAETLCVASNQAQFGDRCIGTAGHLRLDRWEQTAQLGHHMAPLRPGL